MMGILSVNCKAWTLGIHPGQGSCSKGMQGGHPAINWCANRCPSHVREPIRPTDPAVLSDGVVPSRSELIARDWNIRGPRLWAELHTWALSADLATVPAWLANFDRRLGCGTCRTHWRGWISEHPPDTSDQRSLFAWTVAAHNAINQKLGKSEMSAEIALARWQAAADQAASKAVPFDDRASENPSEVGRNTRAVQRSLSVSCEHAAMALSATTVKCSLGLYGGRPHVAICQRCPKRLPKNEHKEAITQAHSTGNAGSLVRQKIRNLSFPNRVPGGSAKVEKLLLRCFLSPGDIVMLTAAVRDLHRAHPGRFATAVETSAPDLWKFNPFVANDNVSMDRRTIEMHYPLIQHSNQRPVHFLQGYAEYLGAQLKAPFPVTEFRGDVYLGEEEIGWTNQVRERFGYTGKFWIMIAGGKYDFTTKWWPPRFYQQVVDHFMGRLQFVQCGQSDHWHRPLSGVFNLVGQTSVRQFLRLIYHSDGVVCPITFAMHLAAAVPTRNSALRPCVVIAGGREPPHWEAYPGHQFLHTIGCLPCCATGGCWRNRCQIVADGDRKNHENLCERPIQIEPDLRVPQCMAMVQPQDVIRAIERAISYSK